MSAETISAIAASASAIAALASVIVAITSWKTQKLQLHSGVMPLLRPTYKFDDPYIEIENVGNGVALGLKLQRSQLHLTDIHKVIKYHLSDISPRTIYPSKKVQVGVEIKVKKGDPHKTTLVKKFELFQFINQIGKHKQLALIYQDIFRRKMILKVQFTDVYVVESFGIRRYGRLYAFWDWFGAFRFRILRWPREFRLAILERLKKRR